MISKFEWMQFIGIFIFIIGIIKLIGTVSGINYSGCFNQIFWIDLTYILIGIALIVSGWIFRKSNDR